MPKLAKSSKYFCALARGIYILHLDFITDSLKEGKFLKPELYEYGNPKFKPNITEAKVNDEVINGPYICRQKILKDKEKYSEGLFTGMKFILKVNSDKREIFRNVIMCGGGFVYDSEGTFKAAVLKREKIDFCLIDEAKALSRDDKSTLQVCSINVKNVRFIYDYLLSKNN